MNENNERIKAMGPVPTCSNPNCSLEPNPIFQYTEKTKISGLTAITGIPYDCNYNQCNVTTFDGVKYPGQNTSWGDPVFNFACQNPQNAQRKIPINIQTIVNKGDRFKWSFGHGLKVSDGCFSCNWVVDANELDNGKYRYFPHMMIDNPFGTSNEMSPNFGDTLNPGGAQAGGKYYLLPNPNCQTSM